MQTPLPFRDFRANLERRCRELFAASGSVPATLYVDDGRQLIELPLAAGGGPFARAELATEVALAVGRARARRAALLLPVLAERGEFVTLLVAAPGRAEAVLAAVTPGPQPSLGEWTGPTVAVEGLFADALALGLTGPPCPACGAAVGWPHEEGCDVECCSACGGQYFVCGCPAHDRLASAWAGLWPGTFECRVLGFYARRTPAGWVPCDGDAPGAREDLNRLALVKALAPRDDFV